MPLIIIVATIDYNTSKSNVSLDSFIATAPAAAAAVAAGVLCFPLTYCHIRFTRLSWGENRYPRFFHWIQTRTKFNLENRLFIYFLPWPEEDMVQGRNRKK
jgi:hypothetical protein